MSEQINRTLASGLPEFFSSSSESNNFSLLKPIAERFTDNDDDVAAVEAAATVDNAETIGELKKHGDLIGLEPRTGESVDKYRARLKAEFVLVTGEGTIEDVINTAAYVLRVPPTRILYENAPSGVGGTLELSVPVNALDNTDLTESDLAEIFTRTAAAGYSVNVLVRGSFTYITPADYDADDFDASKGYDGLDQNGEPKDNGGTYSGVLT